MPDKNSPIVIWTESSLKQSIVIKKYIENNFSEKEVSRFYNLLDSFEKAITLFPELYPKSSKKSAVRRAVLSREMTTFYRIKNKNLEVIAIFDNRCDLSDWV